MSYAKMNYSRFVVLFLYHGLRFLYSHRSLAIYKNKIIKTKL